MAEADETSSPIPTKEMPVFVRVKRKASHAKLDAFWLEINERPLKRPLLDLGSLSISDSAGKVIEESRTKKLLVQHVETISHSGPIKDVLQSFLPDSSGSKEIERKFQERKNIHKQDIKQEQLRSVARQKHEGLARSARFEQIWKSRRGSVDTEDNSLREICHLYDVVRVDIDEEIPGKVQEEDVPEEDNAILCNYLPLIREFLPTAAAEIESDMIAHTCKEDSYVYDLYAVDADYNSNKEGTSTEYPLVQVNNDDDYYDGPLESDYESDDSNGENNPLNDYPDEESSEDEEHENGDLFDDLEGSDSQYEGEIVDVDEEEQEDMRWEHR